LVRSGVLRVTLWGLGILKYEDRISPIWDTTPLIVSSAGYTGRSNTHIYTRLNTCFTCLSVDSPYETRIQTIFLHSGCGRVVYGAGHKPKRLVL